jgi:hypothetical protein
MDSPSEGAEEIQGSGGDSANQPPGGDGSPMTRHDPNAATRRERIAPGHSITPLVHHSQPSAWVRSLEWGGGMTLMALVLAFGWLTVRPTPKRREPELPAPAYSRVRRR